MKVNWLLSAGEEWLGEMKSNCLWAQDFFWGDENVLELMVVMVTQPYDYTTNH